ncbi:MAG TPA: class I SAM-dependent methyltransferase [Flavipsychrobacter sp.]|nr:class I SAM-dependent methyltransferase [Flavipsychrobacter sp.]
MSENPAAHWETVYHHKQPHEVSWTQNIPQTSLDFIDKLNISKGSAIIDVGGGDSKLVDYLLAKGYTNLTVLDISGKALDRAKQRLGTDAAKVKWIAADITTFQPDEHYSLWHDRAAFHFLTTTRQIDHYKALTKAYVTNHLLIGTFSDEGPLKCSGLDVTRYAPSQLLDLFACDFDLLEWKKQDHTTPFGTVQNFLFGCFQKR